MKLKGQGDSCLVGAALSTGEAKIFSLSYHDVHSASQSNLSHKSISHDPHHSQLLSEIGSVSLPEEGLFLAIDWHTGIPNFEDDDGSPETSSNSHIFSISTQSSSIITFQLREGGEIAERSRFSDTHSLHGENLPAWTVFSCPFNTNLLVSGGDDCVCRLWDLRQAGREVAALRRKHEAGVTSGQFHPLEEHMFATGSYDEYLRLWDRRKLSAPLSEMHTG